MFPSWILWNFSNFLRKRLCNGDHGKRVFFNDLKFSLFHKISPLWNIKPVSPHFLKSALYVFSFEHVSLHRDSPYSRWWWTSNNTIPDLSFFLFFFFVFFVALRSNHRIVRHKTDIWWTQQGDHSGRWTKTEKNRTNRWAIERFWLIVLARQNATRVESGQANVPNDVRNRAD